MTRASGTTQAVDTISCGRAELQAIRHDLHAHPELGLHEHRTADVVDRQLESWGVEVHRALTNIAVGLALKIDAQSTVRRNIG